MTYKVEAKVTYNDGESAKVNAESVINPELLTDDKQAEKWGKILFAGLKRYYTKKDYSISVKVEKTSSEVVFSAEAETDGDDW